ncbi:MAG: hypothetical protein DRQ08_06085 [Candidatus Latescibacterota bacterium]|nr:MAG: hypothetical protein DRQ08_06085 [Candidatus Latescibacterota bacterium]
MYRTTVRVEGTVVGVRWKVGEGFREEPRRESSDEEEDIRRELEEQLQRRIEEAYRSGFEDGRRMGWEAAWKKLKDAAEAFKKGTEALRAARDELLKGAEEGVLALAGEVARRVVGVAVERFPEEVVDLVRECLKKISDGGKVVVRVNPDDIAAVEDHREELLDLVNGPEGIEVEPDKRVPRGGCMVETSSGVVNGRLDSMLDEIEKAMREKLELRYVPH